MTPTLSFPALALLPSLVANLIVVEMTAAVLNEVIQCRQQQRWSVLAQYALFDVLRTARLVWTSLLAAASEAVLDRNHGT